MTKPTNERALIQKVSKGFESTLESHFSELAKVIGGRVRMYRMYDSHSAGAFLPEQPGDFMGATARGATLLEAKTSIKHDSLRSCLSSNMDYGQAAELDLWDEAGHCSLVMFYAYQTGTVEIWPGGYVGRCRAAGTRLEVSQRLATVLHADLLSWMRYYFLQQGD